MSKILRVLPDPKILALGKVILGNKQFRCALGKAGIVEQIKKQEGDHATPAGLYFPVQVYQRPNRIKNLKTKLSSKNIKENSGWCDDPRCCDYNSFVTLPHKGSSEVLWRDDNIYDIIIITSHNHAPTLSGKGSAIFFHIAKKNFAPTKGCVALEKKDLIAVLKEISPQTLIRIHSRNQI